MTEFGRILYVKKYVCSAMSQYSVRRSGDAENARHEVSSPENAAQFSSSGKWRTRKCGTMSSGDGKCKTRKCHKWWVWNLRMHIVHILNCLIHARNGNIWSGNWSYSLTNQMSTLQAENATEYCQDFVAFNNLLWCHSCGFLLND